MGTGVISLAEESRSDCVYLFIFLDMFIDFGLAVLGRTMSLSDIAGTALGVLVYRNYIVLRMHQYTSIMKSKLDLIVSKSCTNP